MFPLPQAEPLPPETPVDGMVRLPASPPTYSFPNTSSLKLSESSNGPLSGSLQGMLGVERFLIMTRFQESESRNDVPWHQILPLVFKETFVRQTETDSFNSSVSPLNTGLHPTQGGMSLKTLLEEQRWPIETIRLIADAFLKVPHRILTHEGMDAKVALEFLHDVNPSSIKAQDLLYGLYTRYIQAVVVQEIARLLGWWVVPEIAPFFSLIEEANKRHHQIAMIESGIL